MRRTQLYLDEPLWNALHVRARSEKTTISDLVRKAVREQYMNKREVRAKAMLAIIGMRSGTADLVEADSYIRDLRRGNRIERLSQK